MDIDTIIERSRQRVIDRVPDESPLVGEDGSLLCPWCRRPMRVRFTTLGHIHKTDDDTPVPIDGVSFKCAGRGCGFRPDFDVPITEEEYLSEIESRDGERVVDAGKSAESSAEVESRLEALGYKIP